MSNKTMEVTILGWWGAFPQPNAATCGVMVRNENGTVLLDIGSGTLSQYLCFGNSKELNAVILTHLHYDHMGDLGSLYYLINHDLRLKIRGSKLPVYMPATPELMHKVLVTPFCEPNVVTDGMTFDVAGIHITAKAIKHTIECYAYRLEYEGKVLVYLTDTIYLPDLKDFAKDADLLICESTMSEGVKHSPGTGHMNDIEAGTVARESNAKQLCLYHLPSDGNIEFMRERASSAFNRKALTPDIQRTFVL